MADTTIHLSKATTAQSQSSIDGDNDEKVAIHDDERPAGNKRKDVDAEAGSTSGTTAVQPTSLAKKMLIMDVRLIVWFFIVFLLSFFWRSNIGSGALAAITPDLALPTADYNKGIAVFFICFIVWTIPSLLIQERLIKARYWISFNMLVLGGAQIGMGWVETAGHIWAVRFFLGIGEAGILGGMILFMMHWYKTYQTGFRVSAFFGLGALVGSMSGILAFLLNLVLNNQQGRYGWQWILTTVGLVTFVVGALSFVAIPEYPHSAGELSSEEKDVISSAVSESRGDEAHHEDESVLSALKGAFTSVSAWLFTATSVALFIPVYCFYSYSPTIVSRLMDGRISVRIQLTVIVPVYILACISNFACGYTSDKLRNRSIFIVGGTGLAILGHFLLLISSQTVAVDYFACILVCVGLYTSLPLLLVWGIENHRGALRRAVVAGMMLSFSQIGGVVSRYIFDAASAPAYAKGYGVSLALTALTGIMAFGMKLNAGSHHQLTI